MYLVICTNLRRAGPGLYCFYVFPPYAIAEGEGRMSLQGSECGSLHGYIAKNSIKKPESSFSFRIDFQDLIYHYCEPNQPIHYSELTYTFTGQLELLLNECINLHAQLQEYVLHILSLHLWNLSSYAVWQPHWNYLPIFC